jgi:ornithine carbamoyltransferase
MATFKMPLSGVSFSRSVRERRSFSSLGSQLGVININLGQSSDPDVEQEVLSDVGKQIGRVCDALIHPQRSLTEEEPPRWMRCRTRSPR